MDEILKNKNSIKGFVDGWRNKRKQSLFAQQNEQRQEKLEKMRTLFATPFNNQNNKNSKNNKNNQNSKKSTNRIAKEGNKHVSEAFMVSEWMLDVPKDLGTDWLVYPLPTGSHCLVTASNGATFSHRVSGHRFQQFFKSLLPGGNPDNPSPFTQLDCIYNHETSTFFVRDLLYWNSVSFVNCDAELRLSWIRSKLAEKQYQNESNQNRFAFCAAPVSDCSPTNLKSAYLWPDSDYRLAESVERGLNPEVFVRGLSSKESSGRIDRDGLQFIHKNSIYVQGPNALLLKWKDSTSKYFIDDCEEKIITLKITKNKIYTFDKIEVINDNLGDNLEEQIGRFKYDQILIQRTKETKIAVKFENLVYLGESKRSRAQLLSRIVFQYLSRKNETASFTKLLSLVM